MNDKTILAERRLSSFTNAPTPIKGDTMIKGTLLAEFRLSILSGLIAIILITISACSDSGGDEPPGTHEDELSSSSNGVAPSSSDSNFGPSIPMSSFTFNDIQYWVEKKNCAPNCDSEAMLIVQWNDAPKDIPYILVWGYKFNADDTTATGASMIIDITKADPRLYLLAEGNLSDSCGTGEYLGVAIGGIGFSITGETLELSYDNNDPKGPGNIWGIFVPNPYDYDLWQCPKNEDDVADCGPFVHWQAGWRNGYWNYLVSNAATGDFTYSGLGASSRHLSNGYRDAWNYNNSVLDTLWTPVLPPPPSSYPPPLSSSSAASSTSSSSSYREGCPIPSSSSSS